MHKKTSHHYILAEDVENFNERDDIGANSISFS